MNCKHCNKAIESIHGKVARQYCNDACRKAYARAANPGQNQPRTTPDTQPRTAGKHTCYGTYKLAHELEQGQHNRVPVPGDQAYNGCVSMVNGQWTVSR